MLTTLYDNGDTDGAHHFSVLEELHDAKYAAEEPAKEKRKQRTLKTYECPDPECTVAMLDHKERVVQHINSKHMFTYVNRGQEFVDKLLQDFEKKYPSRKKEISNGFVCKVCGSLISGSVTHLEKHYLRQVRNAKLEDSKRELYAQACKELQENIKRRERC